MLKITVRMDSRSNEEIAKEKKNESLIRIANENRKIINDGYYFVNGKRVDLVDCIQWSKRNKKSIMPQEIVIDKAKTVYKSTEIVFTNTTTIQTCKELHKANTKFIALNFANGFTPGGGYLYGADAQEESLCRCSALYETLINDKMYDVNREQILHDSTSWMIFSPKVPVFRDENHELLDEPYLVDFISSAAPDKHISGVDSEQMLDKRIDRLFEVCISLDYTTLLLGAWGCGAFGNDEKLIAQSFYKYIEGKYSSRFERIIFAIYANNEHDKNLTSFINTFKSLT